MATNMNSLTPSQQDIVNQIITQGQALGAPDVVIEAVINMANAESGFKADAQNGTSSATGLFQYINSTWASSWANFVRNNPSNPLSQMTADEAVYSSAAQIAVTYQAAMGWYNGYDQGQLANIYMPGGSDYSQIRALLNDGIDVTTNFIDYAYFRNNTSVTQTEAIINNPNGAYSPSNIAATAALVSGGSPNSSSQIGSALSLQLSYELGDAQNQIIDPLVLSTNGQAVTTTSLANGAYVDYQGTGFAEQSSWLSSNAGVLVDVTNPNGTLNNGFTITASSTANQNGNTQGQAVFTQLVALDTNHDGVINASDTDFSQIEIWVGSNGQPGSGHLETLAQAGTTSISLNSTVVNTIDADGDRAAINGSGKVVVNDNTEQVCTESHSDQAVNYIELVQDFSLTINTQEDSLNSDNTNLVDYNDAGYDVNGYDINGYDSDGYDSDGYDINGYDSDGYDSDGYDSTGSNGDASDN